MKYTYTALITPNEDNSSFFCRVPDLPGCVTSGKDLDDAIGMITNAAGGWLCVAEDEGLEIAPPTPQPAIQRDPGDILTVIQMDTLAHRAEYDKRAVRKNVSLPAWMFNMAEKRHINCSQVLQDALLAKFSA